MDKKRAHETWSLDRATGINLAQLIVIVFASGVFYSQINANQAKNDERFEMFAKQRDSQTIQMGKFQEIQGQTLVQLSSLTERQSAQTEVLKDIRESLRPQQQGRR